MSEQEDARPRLIVGLGEILWDVFPDGPRFGGAPANFACSVAGLAGDSVQAGMVSAVGDDELGTAALQSLQQHAVATHCISRLPQPTGTVNVALDEHGHATYEFADDTAWDHLTWNDMLQKDAAACEAVCFGTLGQRGEVSRRTIQRFVEQTPQTCLRVFDVNLRPPFWSDAVIQESLQLANVLKMNEDELPVLARILNLEGDDATLLPQIVERCQLRTVILTRGARGAMLADAAGNICDLSGRPVNVIDTVGAGDSYTATVVLGLLRGLPLRTTGEWAQRVAAWVCTQPGATPRIPAEFQTPPA
jgi:fructokinase